MKWKMVQGLSTVYRNYLVVVELSNGSFGVFNGSVADEDVAAIWLGEVHHQTKLVDATDAFENRDLDRKYNILRTCKNHLLRQE